MKTYTPAQRRIGEAVQLATTELTYAATMMREIDEAQADTIAKAHQVVAELLTGLTFPDPRSADQRLLDTIFGEHYGKGLPKPHAGSIWVSGHRPGDWTNYLDERGGHWHQETVEWKDVGGRAPEPDTVSLYVALVPIPPDTRYSLSFDVQEWPEWPAVEPYFSPCSFLSGRLEGWGLPEDDAAVQAFLTRARKVCEVHVSRRTVQEAANA